jgi:hypothetical protein
MNHDSREATKNAKGKQFIACAMRTLPELTSDLDLCFRMRSAHLCIIPPSLPSPACGGG